MTWQPKSQQNAKVLRLFKESMDDINDNLRSLSSLSVSRMRSVARRLSIELRKLLLDGNPLLNAVVDRPQLHPLHDRNILTGDIHTSERALRVVPAASTGTPMGSTAVATHTWKITVHPLHGLRFDRHRKKWEFYQMFDTNAVPIKLNRWLRQRLFCVDGRQYSLWDTLKFLANKEAAHVDTEKDVLADHMECVHFNNTTYCHIVTMLIAAYVLEQYKSSQQADGNRWKSFVDSRGYPVTELISIIGGEFDGVDIDPMGLTGGFHETGIPIPVPGQVWKPVQIEEAKTVCP